MLSIHGSASRVVIPKLELGFPRILRPLLSTSAAHHYFGPALEYANGTNTSFVALKGERDEEHQFGVQIPFRGWLLDADTFQTRANNFLDHSNIGESSIFVPLTVQGALIQAWELTLAHLYGASGSFIWRIRIRLRSRLGRSPAA